jgi:hypothetical protein
MESDPDFTEDVILSKQVPEGCCNLITSTKGLGSRD